MAFTQDQYDKLEEAIGQGVLKVEYADKKVEYRSLNDMMRILKLMGESLGINSNNNGRRFIAFDKGIDNGCSDDDYQPWIQ